MQYLYLIRITDDNEFFIIENSSRPLCYSHESVEKKLRSLDFTKKCISSVIYFSVEKVSIYCVLPRLACVWNGKWEEKKNWKFIFSETQAHNINNNSAYLSITRFAAASCGSNIFIIFFWWALNSFLVGEIFHPSCVWGCRLCCLAKFVAERRSRMNVS